MHIPVMPTEVLEWLAPKPDGIYVDATTGLGGHTGLIAARLETGFLIACDRDAQSLEMSRRNNEALAGRIRFRQSEFSNLPETLAEEGLAQVDGILADLGVSRYQLTSAERGFSLMADGPLDMRMDASKGISASDVVNFYAEKAIADLIYQLGEERSARKIARAIVRARPVRSTLHLAGVVEQAVHRTGRLHPATRTFMALRLFVNDEQGQLDQLLDFAPSLVAPGGRLVVISFMSLEDRKVKDRFRAWAGEGKAKILLKKPLEPADSETWENPASRSAKLRAIEFVG